MNPQNSNISVIDPIGPAFEKVKLILFKPFDLGKWFVIGFCAWLAYLGQGGGGGGGGGPNIKALNQGGFHQARDFFAQNAHWIIPAIIIGVMLGIVLWVVLTWLSSRGKFMFLHCVATNKAEVKIPWHKFRKQGNSLLVFRLVAGLVSFLCLALLVGFSIVLIVLYIKGPLTIAPFVVGLILLIPIIIAVGIAVVVLFEFMYNFVVPIMFLGTTSCIAAWRQFLTLLSNNKGRFILYLLFQLVISIAIGAIIFAAVIMTCCCAACIMAIPYIGTVLLLPLLVFQRAYSLCYLRQYGPRFDVFSSEIDTG